jgi:hypothetical protein
MYARYSFESGEVGPRRWAELRSNSATLDLRFNMVPRAIAEVPLSVLFFGDQKQVTGRY